MTVVVPVHQGLEDVQRCLESVARAAAATIVEQHLLVLDDASPDPDLRAYLDDIEGAFPELPTRLLRNEVNLGFVRTCNRAFRETVGDVVILNSDTMVTGGWLDRLADAATGTAVATVTPLTNFGSICTLPASVIAAFDLDGPTPKIDECAEFVAAHSLGHRPAVITGVGFCMYVTRRALDACGLFDDETFGLGYGEEVDFCLRASALGFRHLVEDATVVYHRGGVSFGDRRDERIRQASEILHRRYPHFRAANSSERAADPLRLPFTSLELGLGEQRRARPHVLQVLHSRPGELGGTEKHFWRLVQSLSADFDLSVLQPSDTGSLLTNLWSDGAGAVARHEQLVPGGRADPSRIDDPVASAALETVLDMYDFDAVHIQNIVNHSLAPLRVLADFAGPVSCSVRDLYLGCPHHWLLYRNRQSCGLPEDLSLCARCLPETRQLELSHLQAFRAAVASRLDTVDHWVFASQSAVDFFLRVYDIDPARIVIIEHGAIIEHRRGPREIDERRILDEPLRLAYVGIGWAKKGLPVVNELAERLVGTGIELHHFGELREPISPLVHQHGLYDNNVLPELLHRAGIQIVLLPGPFLETFGHVMTEAMIAGLPVIGHRHGALGERIRAVQAGWTVDPEDEPALRELITNLDASRVEVLRATRCAVAVQPRSVDATAGRYAELYRSPVPGRAQHQQGPSPQRERLQRELRAMATLNHQLQTQLAEAQRKRVPGKANGGTHPVPGPPAAPQGGMPYQVRRVRRFVGRARRSVAHRGLRGAAGEAVRRSARRLRRAVHS